MFFLLLLGVIIRSYVRNGIKDIRYLVDVSYPDRDKVILVMDNLNTHALSSLYKAFPVPEARRIAKKLEIHYTPKHGSWLYIAEIELNVMTRQCLSRRIADMALLCQELAAWESDRNEHTACIQRQFTANNARTKLISLYPKFDITMKNSWAKYNTVSTPGL